MSPTTDSRDAVAGLARAARHALTELAGTAPETRAVLAGLVLVLGAWVGPGLSPGWNGEADPAPALVAADPGARPVAGGDAYGEAIRTAAGEPEGRRSEETAVADED